MPELPEVESAREVIEATALNRRIVDVDDSDTYVCRPHHAGDIKAALVDRHLVAACRRGKSMWCPTSPTAGRDTHVGPELGIHLGMSGRIVIAEADGREVIGGDYWARGHSPGDWRWARFTLNFADGGRLTLLDPRRFGRIQLDPDLTQLGPDAATITPGEFLSRLTAGSAAVKTRLLDQHVVAGIGNLLADQILWLAKLNPARPAR